MSTSEAGPSVPDFTLLRRIGAGSYGEVWLGRSVTGVLRAVKIIRRSQFADERPFLRELEGLTRFQQGVGDEPRQLALLHVGRDEQAGLFHYVMELADDASGAAEIDAATYVPLTLKELQRRRRWLPAADCARIGAELASALGDLHAAGLLHRDVKPSNVIFVGGRAKLADVGLVAAADAAVTAVGTPEFAAPEGTGSVRADLFSLGKILYELVTGLQADEFPRLPPDLPGRPDAGPCMEVNEIVLRACHPDPARRYPDAAALLSDLRLIQAGRSVQELNRTRRQLRWLLRGGVVATALALAVIAVLGVKNYLALRTLAAQEAAFRRAAEASEQLARYTSDLHFAQLALGGDDLGGARNALRRQIPRAGQPDPRGLEWYALWHETAGNAIRTLGAVGGPPITALALAGDAAFAIERATPNRLVKFDVATGRRVPLADDTYGLAAVDAGAGRAWVTTAELALDTVELATGLRTRQPARGILLERSRDARRVLLARVTPDYGRLFVWDAERQAAVYEWKPEDPTHPNAVFSRAALSGDGSRIAVSLSWNDASRRACEVIVRSLPSGREVARLSELPAVGRMRFSPDGRWLALSAAGGVLVQDLTAGGPPVRLGVGTELAVMEFSPHGGRVAVGAEDGSVTVWALPTAIPVARFRGHEAGVLALDWSADGRRVASGGLDGTIRVWEVDEAGNDALATGLWARELGSVVLSPDGRLLAATDADGKVVIMETARLARVRRVEAAFQPFAFVEGNRALLSLAPDNRLVRTDLTNGTTAAEPCALSGSAPITAFALSPNRRYAALGRESGEVNVWDLRARAALEWRAQTGTTVRALAISNDGRTLIASDWEAHLVRLTGTERRPVSAERILTTSICFSPDGALLAAGTENGQVVVRELATGRVVARLQAHSAEVRSLLFSPDGKRLLSAGADGLVVAWMTSAWRWVAGWSLDLGSSHFQHSIYRLEMDETGSWLVAMTERGELQRWDCRPVPGEPPRDPVR